MADIVTLFPSTTTINIESPQNMLKRLSDTVVDKALVLLIKDVGGTWLVDFEVASMDNSETLLATEILKTRIIDAILGKG